MTIKWTRSVDGYCQSHDGRWRIEPLPMGTTRAQAYALRDCGPTGKGYKDYGWSDTQKLAKEDAEDRLAREVARATHRCRKCGAHWKANGDVPTSWSLVSINAGPCCDNAAPMDLEALKAHGGRE